MKDIIERPFGYKFSRRKIARHVCIDCGINVIKIGDYCMIHADIWEKQLGLRWSDNMCLRCVELRLGRALTAEEVGWGTHPRHRGLSEVGPADGADLPAGAAQAAAQAEAVEAAQAPSARYFSQRVRPARRRPCGR